MENFNVLRQRLKLKFSLKSFYHFVFVLVIKLSAIVWIFIPVSLEFSTIVNGTMKTSYFIRTEKLSDKPMRKMLRKASIRWVNDCECILTKLNPISSKTSVLFKLRFYLLNRILIHLKCSIVGKADNKKRGTIKKVKN